MDFGSAGRVPMAGFDVLLETVTVKASNTGDPISGFSLTDFLSRYLVGNGALRESRHISRKRLALANIAPAAADAETLALQWQIHQFGQAKDLLAKKDCFSLADLCQANKILTPGHPSAGKIRRKQNYVGGKTPESAFYVPPPPQEVSPLVAELLQFLNDDGLPIESRALRGYVKFLRIHPFADGNGRTARAMLGAMLQKSGCHRVHPSIYRLHEGSDGYLKAWRALHDGDDYTPFESYWCKALDWGREFALLVDKLLKRSNIAAFSGVSARGDAVLFTHLRNQPLLTEQHASKLMGCGLIEARTRLLKQVDTGLLQVKKLRHPQAPLIYLCQEVIDTWAKIDQLIFDKRKPVADGAESL